MQQKPELEALIAVARGARPADTVLRGGEVFDVVTGTRIAGDVAIFQGVIAGIPLTNLHTSTHL